MLTAASAALGADAAAKELVQHIRYLYVSGKGCSGVKCAIDARTTAYSRVSLCFHEGIFVLQGVIRCTVPLFTSSTLKLSENSPLVCLLVALARCCVRLLVASQFAASAASVRFIYIVLDETTCDLIRPIDPLYNHAVCCYRCFPIRPFCSCG